MASAIAIPVTSDVAVVLVYPMLIRDPHAALAIMALMSAIAFIAWILGW